MANKYINGNKLKRLIQNILLSYSVPLNQAKIVADLLVTADLRGIHSHGSSRLIDFYIPLIKKKLIKLDSIPKTISKNNSFTYIDALNGFGPYVGKGAMKKSINNCKINGIGITSVINSTHFGIASYYSLMAASQNMIGVAFTNGSPALAPNGGMEPLIGTNALSIAFPCGTHLPIFFDISMSSTSLGNLYMKINHKENVPSSWASSFLLQLIGSSNEEYISPKLIYESRMVSPIGATDKNGGNKGFQIALLFEMVLAVIFGGDFSFNQLIGEASQLFIAIDPFVFISQEKYKNQIEVFKEKISNIRLMEGYKKILIPGEQSNLILEERKRKGIPEKDMIIAPLISEAKNLNIEYQDIFM